MIVLEGTRRPLLLLALPGTAGKWVNDEFEEGSAG